MTILNKSILFLLLLLPLQVQAADQPPLSFANSLADEGDHYRAITEYKRFLHLFPDAPQAARARLSLAQSLIAGKRWAQADQALEKMMEKDRNSPLAAVAQRTYADIAFERNDYLTARDRYLSLLQNSTDQNDIAHARYRIGWTFLEENQIDAARQSFAQLKQERSALLSSALDDYQHLPQKSPGLAGAMSAVLPGSGQLYTGRAKQAGLAFTLNAAFIYGAIEAYDNKNYTVSAILLFFELGWYTGNIYNAANNAHKYNQRQQVKQKGEMRQRFGLNLGWQGRHPALLAVLHF